VRVKGGGSAMYLLHVLEHLVTSPLVQVPVIVILFCPSNAQCTVDTTRSTKESPSTAVHSSVIDVRHWLSDDVPVRLAVEVLTPSSCHVNVLEVGIIGPSFEDEDFSIEVFGETTCYHAA
jgi:hypothetical protein